jgi:hypothetical protein
MHAYNRNRPEVRTAVVHSGLDAFLIPQKSRWSRWRSRRLLATGVVGPAILVLGCAPAHAEDDLAAFLGTLTDGYAAPQP